MRSLFNAVLLLALCAASAGALGTNRTSEHTHESSAKGGSTLRPVRIFVTSVTINGVAFVVPVSSVTQFAGATTTQTAFEVSFATVSILASGLYKVRVCFIGQNNQTAVPQRNFYNVRQDRLFPAPLTATDYAYVFQNTNSSYNWLATWCVVLPAPAAGVHRYSLEARVTANTGYFGPADGSLSFFWAEEIVATPTP